MTHMLHGRNGVLYLTDKTGRELRVDLSDWTLEYTGQLFSPPVFRMTILELPDGTEG